MWKYFTLSVAVEYNYYTYFILIEKKSGIIYEY